MSLSECAGKVVLAYARSDSLVFLYVRRAWLLFVWLSGSAWTKTEIQHASEEPKTSPASELLMHDACRKCSLTENSITHVTDLQTPREGSRPTASLFPSGRVGAFAKRAVM